MRVLEPAFRKGPLNSLIRAAFTNESVLHKALPFIEGKMRQALVERNLECRPPKALQDKCDLAAALLCATPDSRFYPFFTWNSGPCHRYRIEQEFSKQWGTIFQTATKLGD